MKFKSVRARTFGAVLPALVLILFILSLFSYTSSKTLIQEEIRQKMDNLSSSTINQIDEKLTAHSRVAQTLARTIEHSAAATPL